MTVSPGVTYAYDSQGNLIGETTSDGNAITFTYEYRNRLVGAIEKNSGGTTILLSIYTYDALNRRIGVDETITGTETKTWTAYDGKNAYADFTLTDRGF